MMIVGLIVLIAVNIIVLSVSSSRFSSFGDGGVVLSLVAPFQDAVTQTMRFTRNLWRRYFYLVSVSQENEDLKRLLQKADEKNAHCREVAYANVRLRNLLNFQKTAPYTLLAAEIIARDPSPWSKTAIIDRGWADGVKKGLPVVAPEGVVGQIVEAAKRYSRVLMIIDQNSAVDALIQRNRARGIIKGESTDQCIFHYALRKHDIRLSDRVVTSGLDKVFPKGLPVGQVSSVVRQHSGIFQDVAVKPFVDFETLEEVFVITGPVGNSYTDES